MKPHFASCPIEWVSQCRLKTEISNKRRACVESLVIWNSWFTGCGKIKTFFLGLAFSLCGDVCNFQLNFADNMNLKTDESPASVDFIDK